MATISTQSFRSILSVHLISIVLAIVFVALRFYVKVRLVRNTGRDDYTIMFSLVCLFFFLSLWLFNHTEGHQLSYAQLYVPSYSVLVSWLVALWMLFTETYNYVEGYLSDGIYVLGLVEPEPLSKRLKVE